MAESDDDLNRLDNLIDAIVNNLRRLKRRRTETEVAASVKHHVTEVMLPDTPLLREPFDRSRIRGHAERLNNALAEVHGLLASAPRLLEKALFVPPGAPRGQSIEEMEDAVRARREAFIVELERLRWWCAFVIDLGLGLHPNFDFTKYDCAARAYDLMRELSDHKITGTKDDSFRTITSLLYEAASGQQDADLKRACDAVLRQHRQGTDRPTKRRRVRTNNASEDG
jgi:hypothetical protein